MADCKTYVESQPNHYAANCKMANKADLKPVVSTRPNQRHQVDLVNLEAVEQDPDKPHSYKYVVTVLDTFTR